MRIEFIDKIAKLIPPARSYRHHYHGDYASNSPLRPSITWAAIESSQAWEGRPPSQKTSAFRVHSCPL